MDEESGKVSISTKGLDFVGVTLTGPDDSVFEDALRKLLGRFAESALTLKPHIAILSNNSPNVIVAYAIVWTLTTTTGHISHIALQYKFPDAVVPNAASLGIKRGKELLPGEGTVSTPSGTLGPFVGFGSDDAGQTEWWNTQIRNKVSSQQSRMANTTHVTASVDAVIFADGTVAGADTSNLTGHFLAYLKAKQAQYRMVRDSLKSGMSMGEVFSKVEKMARRSLVPKYSRFRRERYSSNLEMYPVIAAQEVRGWRRFHGDNAVERMCSGAIRAEPFVIRKSAQS